MLLKALVTLEGTARLVSPKFSLVEMIQPYRRKLFLRRFSPRRRLRKLHRLFSELEHLVDVLPQAIADILEQMQGGRFDIHLDHRGLEPSVNRLVLGMLASAFVVAASLLLSRQVPPLMLGRFLARRGRRNDRRRPDLPPLAGHQQVGPPGSEEEGLGGSESLGNAMEFNTIGRATGCEAANGSWDALAAWTRRLLGLRK